MSKLDTSVPLLQPAAQKKGTKYIVLVFDIGAIGVVDVGTGAVVDVNGV